MFSVLRSTLVKGLELKDAAQDKAASISNILYLFFFAPNVDKNMISVFNLAKELDLTLESHTIHTDDGYILQLHRIPGTGPPVLLQHGLLCSSACWLTSGKASLAYILSKQGYDVWMGNVRGNKYGTQHKLLTPESPDFWKFTFHHFGQYDIPPAIDKILQVTGYKKITYIGHSMGCTSLLVTGAQIPEISRKLKLVILLAPVAAGHTMTSSLKGLSFLHRHQKVLLEWMGLYTLPPEIPGASWITGRPLYPLFSSYFLKSFAGFVDGYNGAPEMVEHLPSTVSVYTLLHYSQNFNEKSFQAYDWMSREENVKQYGQAIPPPYNIGKLMAPVCIISATQDTLSPPSEIAVLEKLLPNVVSSMEVDLTHLGFIWGEKANNLVYQPILKLISDVK